MSLYARHIAYMTYDYAYERFIDIIIITLLLLVYAVTPHIIITLLIAYEPTLLPHYHLLRYCHADYCCCLVCRHIAARGSKEVRAVQEQRAVRACAAAARVCARCVEARCG
jgi:NADH:ubiquinone oxidoreductase subunit 5 (subunit L)/multisubunit Na+/H+ antiporter MnhA subunit